MNRAYFANSLQHLSRRQVVSRYVYRAVRRAIDVDVYRALCLTPATAQELPSVGSRVFDFRFIESDRLREETADPESGITAAQLAKNLAAGERCFGAFEGDTLASHLWFAPGPAHLVQDVFIDFNHAYAFVRWAWTREPFRGLHLHAQCKRRALDALVSQGKLGILSVVEAVNYESLKSAKRVGGTQVGTLVATCAAGHSRLWTSAGCKAYGIQLRRG